MAEVKYQKLSEIYRKELAFLKRRPRKNYSVLVDIGGFEVMLFYGKGSPGQKPGIAIQARSDTHVPIVYPEAPEWRVKFRGKDNEEDFYDKIGEELWPTK